MILSLIIIITFFLNKEYNNNNPDIIVLTFLVGYFICIFEFLIIYNNLRYIIHYFFIYIIFFAIDLFTTNLLFIYFCYNYSILINQNNNYRNKLLIYDKYDVFECLICYNTSKKYYDIQCTNIEHILCEDCIKNPLMNMKKCPWCNVQVNLLYVV